MSDDLLFVAPVQSRETDERYTPAWVFAALGAHRCGIWLGPVANSDWHVRMTQASDAMVLLRDFAFISPTHAGKRSSMPLSMHGFGERAVSALQRFSQHQPAAGVLLGRA